MARDSQDVVVISPIRDWTCSGCGATGDLLIMDNAGPQCLTCAELDHLVYLPAGDAALTRRARANSRLSAVVVRFSRSRRRYERQGVLVEEPALAAAEQQCLADADARARRAATRGSGRVGRSAAGRALDPHAIELAVIASVRHENTTYDDLLMAGVDRGDARDRVRADVDDILDR